MSKLSKLDVAKIAAAVWGANALTIAFMYFVALKTVDTPEGPVVVYAIPYAQYIGMAWFGGSLIGVMLLFFWRRWPGRVRGGE